MSDSPAAAPRLKVVLCWHMHQPEYRTGSDREYQLPWTYLHGIKDYVDMAAHLEAIPEARAVVNFAPILLDQLADYAAQTRAFLRGEGTIRDPLLAALGAAVLPDRVEPREELIRACLRANEHRVINRFPTYRRLADMAAWLEQHPESLVYLNEQYLADLLVWYHLAWIGETARSDPRVAALLDKGRDFSLHDRRILLEVISELLEGVIPRYRSLAKTGQVELSVAPYAHPIVPLLLDLQSALEATPDARMPLVKEYPGGEQRVRWHIEQGLQTCERHFGVRPKGCWPSEGSVSDATLRLLEDAGFQWAATGEQVLRNSLAKAGGTGPGESVDCFHRAYRVGGQGLRCFFRDDGLSDLIGFTYSDWQAADAVANLIHHLVNIADACGRQSGAVVPIILDGENAWESYPENGYHFLRSLYLALAEHPRLDLTTFSAFLEDQVEARQLPGLVAGSWVYGTFSTWIGDADKNRGWDILADAKYAYDGALAGGHLKGERLRKAERQLAVCEGSDWFWWFGDYNPGEAVREFERLYRRQIAYLYEILGEEPPEYLAHSFTHGGGAQALGGVMRRNV